MQAGESREIVVLMGIGSAADKGKKAIAEINTPEKAIEEYLKLKNYWHFRIEGMEVNTQIVSLIYMMNMWNPYTVDNISMVIGQLALFIGGKDSLGYGDTVKIFWGSSYYC